LSRGENISTKTPLTTLDIAREPRLRDLMEEFLPQITMTQIMERFAFLGQALSHASNFLKFDKLKIHHSAYPKDLKP
jgi:hypothetical protein